MSAHRRELFRLAKQPAGVERREELFVYRVIASAAIIRASADDVGRIGQQLHITGKAVTQRIKNGLRSRNPLLHTFVAARRTGSLGHEAEADTSFLLAIRDEPCSP